jgi:hypothetical protein
LDPDILVQTALVQLVLSTLFTKQMKTWMDMMHNIQYRMKMETPTLADLPTDQKQIPSWTPNRPS